MDGRLVDERIRRGDYNTLDQSGRDYAGPGDEDASGRKLQHYLSSNQPATTVDDSSIVGGIGRSLSRNI